MTAPGAEKWEGPVVDETELLPVQETEIQFEGRVWDIKTDAIEFPGQVARRDYMVHSGAVAIAAVNDQDQIYLLRQYRHPVSMALFELPAGLLDVPGEDPLHTAKRELAEEAGLDASSWNLITDFFTSPGGSSEAIRLYLARDVSPHAGGRIATGEAEEMSLPGVWLDLDEACELVLAGKIANSIAVIGILAAAKLAMQGWKDLRPANADWPARATLFELGRIRSGRR